jgi:hypothetical protein
MFLKNRRPIHKATIIRATTSRPDMRRYLGEKPPTSWRRLTALRNSRSELLGTVPDRTLRLTERCGRTFAEFAVELLGLFLVSQTCFAEFAGVGVHVRNCLTFAPPFAPLLTIMNIFPVPEGNHPHFSHNSETAP